MIHKCGHLNPNAACMENNKCSKRFPKEYCDETVLDESGYPRYMRRNSGIVFIDKNKNTITNQWIVPYNPYLLLKYNAHINVEVCSNFKSYKYLFKYTYKGYDTATLEIDDCIDEIKCYLNCR